MLACATWPWNDTGSASSWGEGNPFGRYALGANSIRPLTRFLGEATEFSPLPLGEQSLPYADELTASKLDQFISRYAGSEKWEAARKQARHEQLSVAVLGVSTTSGGGANEVWNLLQLNGSHLASRKISIAGSWGRRFADQLAQGLQAPVNVDVWYKNAVSANYYSHCTSSYLKPQTSIVLLEIASNLWGQSPIDMLRAVQRVAPRAVIIFIVWPSKAQLMQLHHDVNLRSINSSAAELEADVIHLPQLMAVGGYSGRNGRLRPMDTRLLYAMRGLDDVHPSPHGHALIAGVAARYVAKRLLESSCGHNSDDHYASRDLQRSNHRHPHTGANESMAAGLNAPSDASRVYRKSDDNLEIGGEGQHNEKCYSSADALPLVSPFNRSLNGSWQLVDEGRAKGVPKLGMLSTAVGDTLHLDPWPGQRGCGILRLQLGYLTSTSRPTLGGVRVKCPGCIACAKYLSFLQKLFPFPDFQTYAPFNDDGHLSDQNMSITSTTSFFMIAGPEACTVQLEHLPSDGGSMVAKRYGRRPPVNWVRQNVSEIRIDSLVIESLGTDSREGRSILFYNYNRSKNFRKALQEYDKSCPQSSILPLRDEP